MHPIMQPRANSLLLEKLAVTCASFNLCLLADASDMTDSDNCLACSLLDWSVLISCVSVCARTRLRATKTTQQNTDRHPNAACWIIPSVGACCWPVTRAYHFSPDASCPPLALWRINKGLWGDWQLPLSGWICFLPHPPFSHFLVLNLFKL